MPRYLVSFPEIHICTMSIEADNPTEAIAKIKDGDGDFVNSSFSHSDPGDLEYQVDEAILGKL